MEGITNVFGAAEVEEFFAQADASERLRPGQQGWWQVWGSTVRDITDGDIVLCKGPDGEPEAFHVTAVEDLLGGFSKGFLPSGHDKRQRIGALAPVVIYRRGDRHTLSPFVR